MQSHQSSKTTLGVLLASSAGVAWGLSGVAASTLFSHYPQFTPLWISQVRMVSAGIILLLLSGLRHQHPLAIWREWRSAVIVIAYALLGLIPVQFFYFLAVQAGNASIATILQYLGPFVIVIYYILRYRQAPRRAEVVGMLLAFCGTALIVTHGHLTSLSISPLVLLWGGLSAVGVATNALIPRAILPRFGALNCTGWGLLLAGLAMNGYHPVWRHSVPFSWGATALVVAIVLVGTVLAFILFTSSFSYILPTTASLLDAFEPLSATVFSILLLGTPLTGFDIGGGLLVILAVMCLTVDFSKYLRLLGQRKG